MGINFDPIVEKLETMRDDARMIFNRANVMINSEAFAEIQQECPHFANNMFKLREEIRSLMDLF